MPPRTPTRDPGSSHSRHAPDDVTGSNHAMPTRPSSVNKVPVLPTKYYTKRDTPAKHRVIFRLLEKRLFPVKKEIYLKSFGGGGKQKKPRFSIFANLCRSAGLFLQGSAKIVALNLEDPYRSARSLQKCADFLEDFCRNKFFCSF